jgi:hypothetical protein
VNNLNFILINNSDLASKCQSEQPVGIGTFKILNLKPNDISSLLSIVLLVCGKKHIYP